MDGIMGFYHIYKRVSGNAMTTVQLTNNKQK